MITKKDAVDRVIYTVPSVEKGVDAQVTIFKEDAALRIEAIIPWPEMGASKWADYVVAVEKDNAVEEVK
jgi:hypothetical protein